MTKYLHRAMRAGSKEGHIHRVFDVQCQRVREKEPTQRVGIEFDMEFLKNTKERIYKVYTIDSQPIGNMQ